MIEKYLNDTLTTENAKRVEEFAKVDLIPSAIKQWYYRKDSARMAKEREEAEKQHETEQENSNTNINPKTTFDPEAEPNKKRENDTPVLPSKNLLLIIDDKKNAKKNAKP